jgi:site-specific recombinase XerD
MRCAGNSLHGLRTRALIVLFWRAGLQISEALALGESDLHPATGGVLVRHGKGAKRRGGVRGQGPGQLVTPFPLWLGHTRT